MALNKWDKQHLINLGLTQKQIDSIFTAAVKEAAAIGVSIDDFNPDKPFSFADYPETRARIEKCVNELYSQLETTTVNGTRSAWTLANNKNNVLCDKLFTQKDIEPSDDVKNFIKAYTTKGGGDYRHFQQYDTEENYQKFLSWASKQPKVEGVTVYRKIGVSEKEWFRKFDDGYVEKGNIIDDFGKRIQSFSYDKTRTHTFGGGERGILYEVKSNGDFFVDISKYSHYQEEQEVISLPGLKAKVKDWDYKGSSVYIKAEEFSPIKQKYYSNNDKALEAFLKRKTAGLNLSDRIWNYTDQFKTEIEMGLDLGIRNGLSAAEMARDLKKYLKEPDKLFRRVRDEHGVLQLSKNAKAYHPGAGAYRSSYKNAMRLARTENNMAYRTSDHERWQQLDFVVGIEIRLSNNHTLNGEPFTDICNQLQGKYPKDFKFTGWHPQCRCHAISILKTEEEMTKDNELIMNGEELSSESENTIKDVPEKFKKWITDNKDRIESAEQRGTLPYFLKDNTSYIN